MLGLKTLVKVILDDKLTKTEKRDVIFSGASALDRNGFVITPFQQAVETLYTYDDGTYIKELLEIMNA